MCAFEHLQSSGTTMSGLDLHMVCKLCEGRNRHKIDSIVVKFHTSNVFLCSAGLLP